MNDKHILTTHVTLKCHPQTLKSFFMKLKCRQRMKMDQICVHQHRSYKSCIISILEDQILLLHGGDHKNISYY